MSAKCESADEVVTALNEMVRAASITAAARTSGDYTDAEKLAIAIAYGMKTRVVVSDGMARLETVDRFNVVLVNGKMTLVTINPRGETVRWR